MSSSDHNQHRNIPGVKYSYNTEDSDDTQSDADITWSPGDGICPTTAQFNYCCQSKFDECKKTTSMHLEDYDSLILYTAAFLNLLKNVPPFFHCPPKHVKITGRPKSFLVLRSSLCLQTTEDSSCNQTQKSIDYLQCIGSPRPVTYRTNTETQTTPLWIFHKHCTSLVIYHFLLLGRDTPTGRRGKSDLA